LIAATSGFGDAGIHPSFLIAEFLLFFCFPRLVINIISILIGS